MKAGDALPVRFVGADEDVDAAAVREIDLLKKYHWTSSELTKKVGITVPKAAALRDHLGIHDDPACTYTVPHNKSELTYYSDNAYTRMRDAIAQQDLSAIWEAHRKTRSNARPVCTQPGCALLAQEEKGAS